MEGLKGFISELIAQPDWVQKVALAYFDIPVEVASGNEPTWGGIADILTAMGKTISRGWIKGSLHTIQGMCTLGAYLYGTGVIREKDSPESKAVGSLLEEVIRREMPVADVADMPATYHSWNTAVWFNDQPRTTKADVLYVIGQAIKIAQGLEDAGEPVVIPSLPKPGDDAKLVMSCNTYLKPGDFLYAPVELLPVGV